MAQVIEQLGGISGRIGKGFAKGLSEQLPKEVARSRLSSGIKDLANQDFSKMSPMEQYGTLLNIPGVAENPQIAQQAQQYLQNQNFFGNNEGNQGQPQLQTQPPSENANPPTPQANHGQGNPQAKTDQTTVPSLSEKSSNYAIPLAQSEIENMARQEYSRNPNRFRGYQDYIDYAEKQDAKRVQKEQAFEARQIEADTRFDKGAQEILQKEGKGVWKDLPGDAARIFKNRMKNKIDQGMSAARAADEGLKEVLPLVQARNKIGEVTGFFDRMGRDPTKTRESLENARRVYKNSGNLRLFRDDLISEGMNDAYANYLAYPVREDPAVNNALASSPKMKPRNVIGGTLEKGEPGKSYVTSKEQEKAFDNIATKINDKTSISATALALRGRGYSSEDFMSYIGDLFRDGKMEQLNDRQIDELTGDTRFKPTLMDAYLFAKIGLDPIGVK